MNTNETHKEHRPLALIWGDDDPVNPENVYVAPNPTMARVNPPTQVSNPVYINLDNLEAFQETEQAKRRERVQLFQSQGW